jgi:hypothetical protein
MYVRFCYFCKSLFWKIEILQDVLKKVIIQLYCLGCNFSVVVNLSCSHL